MRTCWKANSGSVPSQEGDGAGPEDPADHGRSLEHPLRAGVEEIDPRSQHGLDRVGDHHTFDRAGGPPHAPLAPDVSFVDQLADDLLQEERVPLGVSEDPVVDRRREVIDGQELADQPMGLLLGEGIERDR